MDDRKQAVSNLQSAERIAGEQIPKKDEDSIEGAREGEERAGGFYSGGRGTDPKDKIKIKDLRNPISMLKKRGPAGLIITLLFGAMGAIISSSPLLPTAIEEMIIQKLNSVSISSTVASDSWLDMQLNYGARSTELRSGKYDYDDSELFALSPWQTKSFEKQGIKVVVADVKGTDVTALLFEDNTYDVWIPVVGSNALNNPDFTVDELKEAIESASGMSVETPILAGAALKNKDFKMAYTSASRTWRGGNMGWFDNIMEDISSIKMSVNRNRFARYARMGAKSIDDGFKKLAKNADADVDGGMNSKRNTGDGGVDMDDMQWDDEEPVFKEDGTPDLDEKGNQKTKRVTKQIDHIDFDDGGSMDVSDDTLGGSKAFESAQRVLSNKAFKAAAAIADTGSVVCSVIEGVMAVYAVSYAYSAAQELNYITGFLESSSKMKAGKGEQSGIYGYAEGLVAKGDVVNKTGEEGIRGQVVATGKTAMESAGMDNMFNNTEIKNNDTSVLNTNIQSVISHAGSFLGKTVSELSNMAHAFEICGYVKLASATIDLGVTILQFIPGPGQVIKLSQILIRAARKLAISAATSVALNMFIPFVAQGVVQYIISDVATEWFGPDLGNVLASAANKYLGGNATSGGQSPGSEKAVLAYMGERDAVIADEAEYQRSIRSPFDTSSPYTFLGSLAYSMIPLAYSGGGVMPLLRQTANIGRSMISKLLPSASAASAGLTSRGGDNCGLLNGMDIAADAYCNPYIITDVSTIRTSPVAINEIVHRIGGGDTLASNGLVSVSSGNFDENGAIADGSDLAKYLVYCGQRTAPYGMKDSGIVNSMTSNSTALGIMPLAGDAQDIYNAIKTEANQGYISGNSCVASEQNSDWGENKYYQRYGENMREVGNMNPGYETNMDAFLREHYEKNPVDTSFEGTLARFSGLTKEKVGDTLALIEYYNYLGDYDPSERYAFGDKKEVSKPISDWFENENTVAETHYVLTNPIIYADIRNRQTMAI